MKGNSRSGGFKCSSDDAGKTSEGNGSNHTSLREYLRAILFTVRIKWFLMGGGLGFGSWGVSEMVPEARDSERTHTERLLNQAVEDVHAGRPIPDSVKTLLIDYLREELDP